MTRGPGDLRGVLPLICTSADLEKKFAAVQASFNKVMAKDASEDQMASVRMEWVAKAGELLCGCMFERQYSQGFLGTLIPDPRMDLSEYDPKFAGPEERHQQSYNKAMAALKEQIEEAANEAGDVTEAGKQRIMKSAAFHRARL
ncbi:Fc.00g082190.m01.CDS01 [Cosmosporella sp. VM-42]